MSDTTLREITLDHAMIARVCRLRVLAWRTQADIPAQVEEWRDLQDSDARHWAICLGEDPVAAVRLTIHTDLTTVPDGDVYRATLPHGLETPIASYNRMVVRPDMRRRGFSRMLDDVSIAAARDMGARCLVGITGSVHGNQHRVDAMVRRGFEPLRAAFAPTQLPYSPEMVPTVLVMRLS